MPQLAPYIPTKDADLDNWALNFSTLLTAGPGTYGLVAGNATAVAAAFAAWHAAFILTTSDSTKTAATVQAKNDEKLLLLATVRPLAILISLNAGVASDDKVAIGVNPRTSVPVPIAAPDTNPSLTVTQALSLQHVVRYRDSLSSPSVKSKPYGAIACELYASSGTSAATATAGLSFVGLFTKSPFTVSWGSGDVGRTASYAARWVTRRGLVGPFSPIVSFTIAG